MNRLIALPLGLIAACGTINRTGDDSSEQISAATTGPYAVVNHVDFTAEAVVPGQAELVVETLRAISTNPAHAIVSIADQAGVPAVAAIYGVLPSVLTDQLEGWINAEIAKAQIGGKPVTAFAGEMAALADLALTHFDVDSTLTVHGGDATHVITALDLSPAGIPITVPIGGLAGDVLSQEPTISIGGGGRLGLGEQHFGLNYGEYAWQGLNAASKALAGADIAGVLTKAINCPAIAKAVAAKCVVSVCVGHEAELTAICTGGLAAAVDLVHARIAAFRLEAFHLASGQATLVDLDGDGIGDQISDGTWDAEMNLGQGLRHTPATFDGSR